MDYVTQQLSQLDIGQIIAIVAMQWFTYSRLNGKIDVLDEKISKRIDRIDEKLTDIDRRVCRIEGAMMHKKCCILHHESKQKAE